MAGIECNSPITVFDLPQLHHKPSASTILSTFRQLAIVPSSFSSEQPSTSREINEDGLTGYLTRFIASPLNWISSDIKKEEIWEAASQRLSERSGRMAMASISRTFTVCDFAVKRDGRAPRYIHISLNEPSLTDDNVGHKTWSGSFLLAKRLAHMMAKHFPTLIPPPSPGGSTPTSPTQLESIGPTGLPSITLSDAPHLPSPPSSPTGLSLTLGGGTLPSTPIINILELGAGTGLTGIAAAALFTNVTVRLTDLPSIVPNLKANIESNSHYFATPPTAAVLDWSISPATLCLSDQYDCILAADSLYDPRHPAWLTNTMVLCLKRQKGARIMVELPFRDMDLPYHDLLREDMTKRGLEILEEGEESGWDDWEGSWSEKMAVKCWWSVWGWSDGGLKATDCPGKTVDDHIKTCGDNQDRKNTKRATNTGGRPKDTYEKCERPKHFPEQHHQQ